MHIPEFHSKKQEKEERINSGYIGVPVKERESGVGVGESIIYHTILPVTIRKRSSSKSVTTYAFYDNGSGRSFITENLQIRLGVKGVKTALQLGTMHGRSYISSNLLTILVITGLSDDNPI